MVANPMQKKARNSFLLGMAITLIVCLILFALFYFLVINNSKKQEERGEEVIAYVLSKDIKSGETITSDAFKQITVYSNMVPSNYITNSMLNELTAQDIDGNILYSTRNSETEVLYIELEEETASQYLRVGDSKTKVLIKKDSGGYYRNKITGEKEYIEFYDVPVVAKVDLKANTILTTNLISKSDQVTTGDVRYVEYNMLTLPTTIEVGDYIDIRLTLPNGQDLIVVSKREVKTLIGDTIGLELTEGDIQMLESAIVEAYIMTASKLYAIQYIEPGNQNAAAKTYAPTVEVQGLIQKNPNITENAKKELLNRFNGDIRTWTNNAKNAYGEEGQQNLETGIQKEIENAKAAREAYLSGLTSY